AIFQGRLKHMRVDQYREHTKGFVFLDESHATHVGSEIVDVTGALGRRLAVLLLIQIQREILNIREALVPMMQRLDVNGANALVALRPQGSHQSAADKSTGTSHKYEIVMRHVVSPKSVTVIVYCNAIHWNVLDYRPAEPVARVGPFLLSS